MSLWKLTKEKSSQWVSPVVIAILIKSNTALLFILPYLPFYDHSHQKGKRESKLFIKESIYKLRHGILLYLCSSTSTPTWITQFNYPKWIPQPQNSDLVSSPGFADLARVLQISPPSTTFCLWLHFLTMWSLLCCHLVWFGGIWTWICGILHGFSLFQNFLWWNCLGAVS